MAPTRTHALTQVRVCEWTRECFFLFLFRVRHFVVASCGCFFVAFDSLICTCVCYICHV